MDTDTLERYSSWFSRFVQEHDEPDARDQRNIQVKEEHTHRVYANTRRIAAGLGLDARETALAASIALFHDVGRFPQYRSHRTFEDSRSVNHAVLGAKVLLERDVLRDIPTEERSLIVRAVTLHNVFMLPPGLDDRILMHARLIRDADKLDIWRVFIELTDTDPARWPSAVNIGLPDTPGLSPGILACLGRREMVRLTNLRNLNDFRLLQLAWIYDLNFAPSLRMVLERDVIERLSLTIPRTPEIGRVLDDLRRHVEQRLLASSP